MPGLWHQSLHEHMKVKNKLQSCWKGAVGGQMQRWCDHCKIALWELLLEPTAT